jgi:DNA-binding transcriptional MerR regulator
MPQRANVYLLKDLARLSGQSIHTLKFYLKKGLIKETGRSPETRFRFFDDSTLAVLSTIRSLRKQRKSLSEIQDLLQRAAHPASAETQTPSPSA